MKKIKTDFIRVLLLRTFGNFLILSSLFFIGKMFYLPVQAEVRFYIDQYNHRSYVVAPEEIIEQTQETSQNAQPIIEKGSLAKAFKDENVELLVPINTDFSIVIPKIAANAPIISNVNAGDEKEYLDALQKGVAHTKGTAFPGEGGHMFFFAHSTDYIWNVGTYNAVFYLLYKLETGDEINLFYKGKRYVYTVTGREIISPDEIDYIRKKTNKEFLTLQTCWPPGTTLKRLLIFAERKVE
ncbi:sortase [Candidatus Woesebacteria bacterium]|nr:sortase [Candidatus Woesebacteria bacterium]